jgi:hypothetical protein
MQANTTNPTTDTVSLLALAIAEGDLLTAQSALQSALAKHDLDVARYTTGRRSGRAFSVDVDTSIGRQGDAIFLVGYTAFAGRLSGPDADIELDAVEAVSLAWLIDDCAACNAAGVIALVERVRAGERAPLLPAPLTRAWVQVAKHGTREYAAEQVEILDGSAIGAEIALSAILVVHGCDEDRGWCVTHGRTYSGDDYVEIARYKGRYSFDPLESWYLTVPQAEHLARRLLDAPEIWGDVIDDLVVAIKASEVRS